MSIRAIKDILTSKFPDVEFDVTEESFSSVGISYKKGPDKSEIRSLISHFQISKNVIDEDDFDVDNRIPGIEQFEFVMIYRGQ